MRILLLFSIFILILPCSSFDLSPPNPNPGDKITLTGKASPGEQLTFRTSFSMNLPVNAGQYYYETSVEVPPKPNRLVVNASNVRDINLGIKFSLWITKRIEATRGMASISQSDIPPGKYALKLFGQSQAASVPVDLTAETQVKADDQGDYSISIDTSGIPAGSYRIEGAGDSKIINLV